MLNFILKIIDFLQVDLLWIQSSVLQNFIFMFEWILSTRYVI